MNLQQANKHLNDIIVDDVRNGDGWFTECNDELNDATRNLIEVFEQENGGVAWLGHVNLYNDDRVVMWQDTLDDVDVCNFGASFIIPAYDATLERLILERKDATYTGTSDDYVRIDAIFDRIEALGGQYLHWT